jgi:hypothetical protein
LLPADFIDTSTDCIYNDVGYYGMRINEPHQAEGSLFSVLKTEKLCMEMIREAYYDSTGFVPAPYLYSQAQKRTHEKKTVSDYRTDTIPAAFILLRRRRVRIF